MCVMDKHLRLSHYTNKSMHIYIYYIVSLKFILKHLKPSYMYRSHDHPQVAYIVPC